MILASVLEKLSSELFTSEALPVCFTQVPAPKDQNVYTTYLNTSIAQLKKEQESLQDGAQKHIENLQEQIQTLELENAGFATTDLQQKEHASEERNQISSLQLSLQEVTTTLRQQEQQTATLLEEIEDLKDQNNDLEMYNGAYQREVEQLKQQLEGGSGKDMGLKNITEELQKANGMLEHQNAELESLQKDNAELKTDRQTLGESLKEMQQQQQQTETVSDSPSESNSGGGGVKFGVLKRKIRELEEKNLKLQAEVTSLKEQTPPLSSLTDGEDNELKQEIEDLKEQINDLQNYNSAYQREVEQLKQQLEDVSGNDTELTNITEELQRANEMLTHRNGELERLQKENSELNTAKQKLEEMNEQLQQQQQQQTETSSNSPSESSGGSVKFGVLKRQIKELEENNLKLQTEVTVLKQQTSQLSSSTDDKSSVENSELKQETEDLKEQINDLQNYNSAYQREVEQLKQQLQESSAAGSNQAELQESVNNLNQQLLQYQTYCTNMQAENEHLKRLSQAAVSQGSDQEVAVKMELQNQIVVLTNENYHYQTEYENLRQSWIKYQQESATYMESLQQQNQQLQLEYQQLQQQQQSLQSSFNSQPASIEPATALTPPANSSQLQGKLHDLSLMLTEKTEECARLQQENDNTKAKLVEVQNDSSDMELVREECKQLKAMLMSKGDEEIISSLQMENKRLKQQMDHVQKLDMEKDNDLSDMELLKEECRQLKLMLVNKDSPAQFQQLEEQKTQLEHSLRTKDEELSHLNASLIEMQNSVSDMDLVREECKQLKTMLMNSTNQTHEQSASIQSDYSDNSYKELEARLKTREDELRHKDSIIYEMQNTSGDVELLRQQCEQLKSMLSERENNGGVGANNTFNDSSLNPNNTSAFDNSFMVQVQQLEEVMKEKDQVIYEKDQVISEKDLQLKQYLNRITELENSCSDMELLHTECRALKEMIGEKETMFAELQNDLDLANSMVEQRHTETSVKNTENQLLRDQIKELSESIASKDVEISNMRDEMQEATLQDENIHMLQTEYRNVEEQLKGKEKELLDSQQRLFEMETHCERMKVYEEQYQTLKDTLIEKDAELSTLQLQSSESSILESETVTLLQQELNQLKTLLYEKENEIVEINKVLEKKNVELQDLSNNLNQMRTSLNDAKMEKDDLHRQLEQVKADADKIQKQQQQQQTETASANSPSQSNSGAGGVKFGVLKRKIKELEEMNLKLQQTNGNASGEMESQVIYYKSMVDEVNVKYNNLKETLKDTVSKCELLTKERDELRLLKEGLEDEYKAAADVQNVQIERLQQNMLQNEEHQQALIERLTNQSSESTRSVEGLQQEKHIVDVFVSNMNGLLQISSHQDSGATRTEELTLIIQQVQVLLNTLQQREALLQRMQEDHQSQLERLNQDLLGKSKQLDDSLMQFKESEFKMTDLQSQVQEYQELELMYQAKCQECEQLQTSLSQLNESAKQQQQQLLQSSPSSKNPEESEHLREELLKSSNTLLDKTKECDQLKLDMLKLEEKVFNQEQMLAQTQGAGTKLQELTVMCQRKDEEIQRLQLQLEDSTAVLESGKKEKAFLDQLVKEKNALAAEKEELVFQFNQLNGRLQEQDIALKHKDTNSKEVEAKTKRELERLRNHLMMV